jgi:uncharacterized protein YecT (DUF1311 family)
MSRLLAPVDHYLQGSTRQSEIVDVGSSYGTLSSSSGSTKRPAYQLHMRLSHGVMFIVITVLAAAGCSGGAPTTASHAKRATTTIAAFPNDPQCENGDDVRRGDCVGAQLSAVQTQLAAALIAESKWIPGSSIRKSQSDWTTYRNAECRLVASTYQGGTMYPWIVGACEWQLTKQRLAEVQQEVHLFDQFVPKRS